HPNGFGKYGRKSGVKARPWAYCRQMKVQFILANVQQLLQRMMDKCFWNYKGKTESSLDLSGSTSMQEPNRHHHCFMLS
uniref:Uncharacterized protein n=1 Tax=Otus sunia TaxID=257818 RepID=A0A8C8AJ73_9STRI